MTDEVAVEFAAADRAQARAAARLGQPPGLVILAGTEFWERISFHGMQALLVLYMADELLQPAHVGSVVGFTPFRRLIESVTGPLSVRALATQIFGLYIGLIYFMPVFGGLLGDRVLGRRRAVILGATLMAAGHFCMAFDRSFLIALLLLIGGAGCLRGNLAAQVGDLYSKTDRRRADAFQIYYALLNMGAFLAPLITGALAQAYGWHYGFGFAGVGMLAGLIMYIAGRRWVPLDTPRTARRPRVALDPNDRHTVAVLCGMLPLLTLFWIAQTQIWNTYNLWARDHLNLKLGAWLMPVPWLQAVDALAAVVLMPPVLLLWRWQRRHGREPDDLKKMAWGCGIFAVGLGWLAAGSWAADASGKVPLPWALAFHFIYSFGYVFFAPIAVAFYSRTAPAAINAMMVSVYFLAVFAGSLVSGRIGGYYENLLPGTFWLLHAAIVGSGGLLIAVAAPRLRRALKLPPRGPAAADS